MKDDDEQRRGREQRIEGDRRTEQSRRRFAQFAAPGGPWEVKDVSQTGFRLLAPMSVANTVTLGSLTAIRPQGQVALTLGLVRFTRNLLFGLQPTDPLVLAVTFAVITLVTLTAAWLPARRASRLDPTRALQ